MRNRQRTTARGVPREVLEMASVEVLDKGHSVRAVAKTFEICHVTLQRYIRKVKELKETGSMDTSSIHVGYRSHKQVFQPIQEAELLAYLTEVSGVHCGLSSIEVRRFAFQLAKHNQLKYPEAWDVKEMAGKDWFTSFMKRNPMFPIKNSPATGQAIGFNRENVSNFFKNLATVLQCENLEAKDVWNVDETGITTGQAPEEMASTEDGEQTEGAAMGSRGALVTMAVAVNALGNSVPPHLVFPTKTFYRHFIRDAPTGSIGSANGCGRMQEAEFLVFLHHFVKHTRASVSGKVLLLLDNNSTHMSAEAMDYCDANGVVLLAFPPHCSHKLQPLVRGVFGPFRKHLHTAMDCWMKTHPGMTSNIYDLPGLIAQALPISITPRNITSGFRCTGIWPFNSNIFSDEDFAPSSVADLPDLTTYDAATANSDAADPAVTTLQLPSLPSTSTGACSPFRVVELRTAAARCRHRESAAAPVGTPVNPAREEEAEREKEGQAEPKAKGLAQVKSEAEEDTDLTSEGDSNCLFCDDYYLTTVV
ncbi:uncharacterized protein LOC133135689 [Conger conger]|nr:uncharacterized protein LOC133135689 [Conger conger]